MGIGPHSSFIYFTSLFCTVEWSACIVHLHTVLCNDVADAGRFQTDVISVRLGRPVSREELLAEHAAMTDTAKCSAAAAQWKFLCIEGSIYKHIQIGSRPSDHYFRSVCLFVCLFVQSFSQPSLIRFRSN